MLFYTYPVGFLTFLVVSVSVGCSHSVSCFFCRSCSTSIILVVSYPMKFVVMLMDCACLPRFCFSAWHGRSTFGATSLLPRPRRMCCTLVALRNGLVRSTETLKHTYIIIYIYVTSHCEVFSVFSTIPELEESIIAICCNYCTVGTYIFFRKILAQSSLLRQHVRYLLDL